jgi:hypothetical protein
MANNYPGWNYVICHTKHAANFDGEKGADWDHLHREYDIKIGGIIGYDIYFGKGGTFELHGDGGYLNVSYFIYRENHQNPYIQSSGHTPEK